MRLRGCPSLLLPVLLLLLLASQSARAQESAPTSNDRGVLVPLYVSFTTLQVLDAHSTLRALDAGAVEANPIMGRIADNPLPLFVVKAGAAAGTIFLTEKLRRRSRVGAIVLMATLNSAYAMVVTHNYRAVRR